MTKQTVYIYLDDSGNLCKEEVVSCFGGVVFISNEDRMNFINRYRSIVNRIKRSYPEGTEIKSSKIKGSHRRQLLNLIYQQHTFGVIIRNQKLTQIDFSSKLAIGKYEHFAQKLAIKGLVDTLIKKKIIDPNKNLEITINSDQHTTATDGIYDLRQSVLNELKYGTKNFKYGVEFLPIIHGNLNVIVNYYDSRINYGVQASDILAGELRKKSLDPKYTPEDAFFYLKERMTCIIKLPK